MSQDFISSSIENLLLAVLFACKCSSYFLNLNDVNFDWWLFHIFFNLVHFLILAISHFFIFSFAQKYILCLYLFNFNPVCAKTILTAVLNCLLYIVLPSYVVLVVVMVGNALCSLIMWWLSVVITPFCRFQKWVRFRDTSRGGHHFLILSSLSRTMRATL